VHPTDPNIVWAASQDNGTEKFTGSLAWTHVDDGDGGEVHVDPNNPNIVFHVLNGTLRKSTLGGAAGTWSTLNTINGPQFPTLYFPFVIDNVNSSRLVVGGGESFGAPGAGRRNN